MTNILIIDDNLTLLDIYSEILRKEGYCVSVAGSGSEGLEIIKDKNFEIVLLDVMMDPMNGWEVLKAIRGFKNSDDSEIVILTAKALHPDEVLEYGDFIQGFIMKPVHIENLKDYINTLVLQREKRAGILSGFSGDNADAAVIFAYEKKKQQIGVWEGLLNVLEEIYGVDKIDENPEFREKVKGIKDAIAFKKSESDGLKMALDRA